MAPIQERQKTRVEKLIDKLTNNQALIEAAEKGEITANFSGDSVTVTVKVYV